MKNFLNKGNKNINAIKVMETMNISIIRENIKVLVVDDEEYGIVELLKERKFDVYYKSDITYAIEAEPFDIVILDIKGVAKRLGSSMEGFSIALEIKKRYPEKKVCCYSGTVATEIAERLKEIDAFIRKDSDIDRWEEHLDNLIKDYIDRDKRWEIIKKQLTDTNVPEEKIKEIEREYRIIYNKGSIDNFISGLFEVLQKSGVVIEIVNSVLSLVKIISAV